MKNFLFAFIFVIISATSFRAFFLHGYMPIPTDALMGLYHPFRDLFAYTNPNGIAFKNFLITDPFRQEYPWRYLAITVEKSFQFPLWNPYSFSGMPLMANLQTAAFYPLNIFFYIFPFPFSWSFLIFTEPLLAGIFIFWYLKNLKLSVYACLLGGISFSFCGFSVAWLEWGTVLHTALWFPLILLSIDRITSQKKTSIKWNIVLFLALISSFFAGHLQIFFYILLASLAYFIYRSMRYKLSQKQYVYLLVFSLLSILITSIQWIPLFQLIMYSARQSDQLNWQQPGWFIPWQHLVQFVVPDFFGNPTTLNYFGVWNYGELIGYIGVLPLLLVGYAVYARKEKTVPFMFLLLFISLLFSLPNFVSILPFVFHVPFLSTSQPTRLMILIDFSLCVLSAFGLQELVTSQKKHYAPLYFFGVVFILVWAMILFGLGKLNVSSSDILVAKHNTYFPTLLLFASILLIYLFISKNFNKSDNYKRALIIAMLALTLFDLLRFSDKFNPFTPNRYLFPQTSAISYLQNQPGQFRIMENDARIFPPNISIMYKLQSVDGYDPLYLLQYGELIIASERGKPNIAPPFGFNRIITPTNYSSKIMDLLGVKYVMSLSDISSPKLTKVFQEGQTRIYQNKLAFPRMFFVNSIIMSTNKQDEINLVFNTNLHVQAIVETSNNSLDSSFTVDNSSTISSIIYSENEVSAVVNNNHDGFLVFTDSYYPSWHVRIDGQEVPIYKTDYALRGIFIPKGMHNIVFYDTLF